MSRVSNFFVPEKLFQAGGRFPNAEARLPRYADGWSPGARRELLKADTAAGTSRAEQTNRVSELTDHRQTRAPRTSRELRHHQHFTVMIIFEVTGGWLNA